MADDEMVWNGDVGDSAPRWAILYGPDTSSVEAARRLEAGPVFGRRGTGG
ncbi:MAG: hypothetical protein GKR89_05045 [Candidatus Latescibacteria bacterium]|nr:hypothetical protein [Candidatus Latescibacterota bacterium]